MEKAYIEQYLNKTELEQLKTFLLSTDSYTKLLLMVATPKQVLCVVEEPFLKYLTQVEVLDRIDKNEFNYEEEAKRYGFDIELDALSYACAKLHVDISECESIKKSIKKMKSVL